MNPVAAVIGAKLRMASHWAASSRTESKLKIAFVGVSAVLLWGGALLATLVLLHLLQRFGKDLFGDTGTVDLVDALLTRLLSVGALVVLVLLLVSNVLVSFATLYRAREVAYLVQAPISRAEFFLGRLWECGWLSSWGVAFLGSPLLLAYGLHRGVPPAFYLALPFFFPVFIAIPTALGAMITMTLVRVLAGRRRGAVLGVALITLVMLFLLFQRSGGLPDFEQAETVQALAAILARTDLPLLPSTWLSSGLLSAATGDYPTTGFYWLVLCANALFLSLVATLMAERWFYPGWSALVASDEQRPRSRDGGLLRFIDILSRPLPEPTRSLMRKDIKLFWRDPSQWSQFLIFFGLMTLYVANMRPSGGLLGEERFRSWVAILNMAASMLVLATLTTRFVFPLISLEGRRFWILGLAPLTLRRLLLQKFALSVALCSTFTLIVALLSGWRLGLAPFEFGLTVFGVLTSTLALSGLAVGLGSLYPNFQEDNPSRITSGLGGTLNFILSLVFIVVVVALQTFVIQWRRSGVDDTLEHWITAAVFAAIISVTTATTWIPLRLGLRNLRRAEF